MKKIQITNNKEAIVDDDDYERLSYFSWYYGQGYARTMRNGKHIKMHRLVANSPEGVDTDHINHNKLDNRKENLRVCTRSQNSANKPKQANNTSGYKGVSWNKHAQKWVSYIKVNGKVTHLGCFSTPELAARAYNNAAVAAFGNFSYLNIIKEEVEDE